MRVRPRDGARSTSSVWPIRCCNSPPSSSSLCALLLALACFFARLAFVFANHRSHFESMLLPAEDRSPLAYIRHVFRQQPATWEGPELQCLVLDDRTATDLCARSRKARLKGLRDVFLFEPENDNSSRNQELTLHSLFLLRSPSTASGNFTAERELNETTLMNSFLSPAITHGCLTSSTNATACLDCFDQLSAAVSEARRDLKSFSRVLSHYDCRKKTADPFYSFSYISNCSECKRRYQDWLLMSRLALQWPGYRMCLNRFCDAAELHCPHLRNTPATDYAGLPAFRCTDTDIAQSLNAVSQTNTTAQRHGTGHCIDPCDIHAEGVLPAAFCNSPDRNRLGRVVLTGTGLSAGAADREHWLVLVSCAVTALAAITVVRT